MSRTYGSLVWVLLVAALAAGSGLGLRAEEGGEGDKPKTEGEGDKPKAEGDRPRRGRGRQGFNLWTSDTINEKLGDQKLSDEQKTKVDAARDEIGKKFAEIREKPEFKAAVEEMRSAGQDKDKRAAARKKMEDASGGFNQATEFKKALEGILTKEQLAKLYPEKPEGEKTEKSEGEGKHEEKTGEAHEEKTEEKEGGME